MKFTFNFDKNGLSYTLPMKIENIQIKRNIIQY